MGCCLCRHAQARTYAKNTCVLRYVCQGTLCLSALIYVPFGDVVTVCSLVEHTKSTSMVSDKHKWVCRRA